MGQCLGRLCADAGYAIAGVCCRTQESAEKACEFMGAGTPFGAKDAKEAARSSGLVVIGTADSDIIKAEAAAAAGVDSDSIAIHLSGALPSSILKQCKGNGASIGSMHPLQSFADPLAAIKNVPGSIFACEGDENAVKTSFHLAKALRGKPVRIKTSAKTLYHAAAAAASNFLLSPLVLGLDLMEQTGLSRQESLQVLLPLIRGTINNAAEKGAPEALTGPIERGDLMVVQRHLQSIKDNCPALLNHYVALALQTVEGAFRKGAINQSIADEMNRLLNA